MTDRAQMGPTPRWPSAVLIGGAILAVIAAETSIATALSVGVVSVYLWFAWTIPSYMPRV
ncbi:hypothetical protein [Halorubrum sp. 48-1-W]|uniref:hypothetical protein n=1 Tax=Halorubrum sp. 48-1-W TaxID=2249761 RepID=UPI000FCC94E5|nr:hypothetical protein [Halorubrum sp. 48-1-W]